MYFVNDVFYRCCPKPQIYRFLFFWLPSTSKALPFKYVQIYRHFFFNVALLFYNKQSIINLFIFVHVLFFLLHLPTINSIFPGFLNIGYKYPMHPPQIFDISLHLYLINEMTTSKTWNKKLITRDQKLETKNLIAQTGKQRRKDQKM